ncbi:ras-related protein Rab-15 isoform X3 [Salvelinus sp. IW2-2015]|uniref:ras-related protein Rab-15 isoform X3 n=1 Tax=Salvelinus sp. IW2-2015 TaxID=2691554 RepID=UPI0038D43C03
MASKCGYRYGTQQDRRDIRPSLSSTTDEHRTPTAPDVTGRPKRSSRTTTTRATACSLSYHPEGEGIFLVYDITSERSFQHIMKWASDVDEYAPDNIQKILIGNKSDEEEKRQVATEQGNKLAKDYGMDFFETSASTNYNITESFTRLAEQVLAANKKDLDLLRASVTDELNLAALEEEEGITDGAAASKKGCWC